MNPNKIKVPERLRTELGPINELAASIKHLGMIQPIIVDTENNLVCGERRLKAALELGMADVPIKRSNKVDDLDKLLMEFEENNNRLDFTWQERALAKKKIHDMFLLAHGMSNERKTWMEGMTGAAAAQQPWTQKKTAQVIGDTRTRTVEDLILVSFMDEIPKLQSVSSAREGLRIIKRYKEFCILNEMAKRKRVPTLVKLYHGDSAKLIDKLKPESVAMVLLDPPWGAAAGAESIGMRRALALSTEGAMVNDQSSASQLLDNISKGLLKALVPDCHIYMFFDQLSIPRCVKFLEDMGFRVQIPSCIWVKEHHTMTDFQNSYAGKYESFLFASRGKRSLNFFRNNIFEYGRPDVKGTHHPTEKPEDLIEELIKNSTQEGELVLDPFCGSGSTLRAALKCNRRSVGFELEERWYKYAKAKVGIK